MKKKTNFSLKAIRKYIYRVGVSFDIFINVLLGGNINQTFSARNWQLKKDGKPNLVWLIDILVFWDHPHCMNSWLYWHTKINMRKVAKPKTEFITPRIKNESL